MSKKVLVYIEGEGGGGNPSRRKFLDGEFRKSWKTFLQPLANIAMNSGIARFQCIPGRGGESTAEQFRNPLPQDSGALRILIVDSEGPVADIKKPWTFLKKTPPAGTDDNNCYLMVQCLETWLLADVDGLRLHYSRPKNYFRDAKIKPWPNLEAIARKTIQTALEHATAQCPNPYSHADGNLLIAIVDRQKLLNLPSVKRLFSDFEIKIKAYAAA